MCNCWGGVDLGVNRNTVINTGNTLANIVTKQTIHFDLEFGFDRNDFLIAIRWLKQQKKSKKLTLHRK
jgi:hypothetical protein